MSISKTMHNKYRFKIRIQVIDSELDEPIFDSWTYDPDVAHNEFNLAVHKMREAENGHYERESYDG